MAASPSPTLTDHFASLDDLRVERHVGWGIVTSNLTKIAETVAARAA